MEDEQQEQLQKVVSPKTDRNDRQSSPREHEDNVRPLRKKTLMDFPPSTPPRHLALESSQLRTPIGQRSPLCATVSPAVSDRDSVVNCSCPFKDPNQEFYIRCDFCSEWFHGHCFKVSEDFADHIHTWACSSCSSPAQATTLKIPCARSSCTGFAKDMVLNQVLKKSQNLSDAASMYCSETCAMDAGRASLASILPKVPKKKVPRVEPHFETLPGPAFDSINHSYDYSDMDSKSADPKLAQRISELGSAIRDVEKRLSLIDETVDKTYQWNRKDKEEGSGKASCCGYDQRIRGEWLQPGLASMSDVQFSSEQGNDAGVAPANEENGEVQEDAKPGPWLPTQCKVPGKCSKHHGWQRVRVLEAELERDSLIQAYEQCIKVRDRRSAVSRQM